MKKLLLLLFAVLFYTGGHAQNPWQKADEGRVSLMAKLERASNPVAFNLYSLNVPQLKATLLQAPNRESADFSNVVIPVPSTDGKFRNYRMYATSVMHPELASRYLDIKTYVGIGVENSTELIRLSTTIFGVHVMSFSDSGTSYIDPFTTDLGTYVVYNKRDLRTSIVRECLTLDGGSEDTGMRNNTTALASDGLFRTYRLAMASTIEYSAYHINAAGLSGGTLAQKKAAVLAAMVVSMNRINGVYERDMSLTMQLVPNNDAVIFVDSDNFSNDSASQLINQSQTVIDSIIGTANYDIGHTVSTGGGGLAQKPSVCINGKARGITGSPAPVGDAFDIDFVAHELGHQFGADHTFNGLGGNCAVGTRANTYAVEPGSGSTIMAYAGICSGVDVQSNSDAYFHAVSIAQMVSHITGSGNCVVGVPNGNAAPVVNAGTDYTIPYGTPFVLTGSATDTNGDALTYTWEQIDNQVGGSFQTVAQPPLPTNTAGPTFRSISPSPSPVRYFPNLTSVIGNNLAPTWEVVPGVARTMNFALTARDNRTPNGGQTGRDDMTVTTAAVGPFRVTSQNTDGITWMQGSTQTITWDVAGTTGNGINTALVNILLSTDGGLTYPIVLASATQNDGSQAITVPNVAAPFTRIMVQSVGNIFYALNTKSVAIGYTVTTNCTTYSNTTPMPIPDGSGANLAGPAATSVITVPENININDINVTVNGTHSFFWDLVVSLRHPDGTSVRLLNRNCNQVSTGFNILFNDGAPSIACAAAVSGTFSPNQPLSAFNNKPSNGNWTLIANDFYNGDTGTINSWSMEICTQIIALATTDFGLADFAIYPNPNTGNFTVKFSSASTNDVGVTVHDMRGRTIFENKYSNTGLFNQEISLDKVQSGIYLVTVQDGDRQEVKRIIVE